MVGAHPLQRANAHRVGHPQDRAGGTRKARMGDWRGWEVRLG
jgi:hypothetical protein